MATTTPGSQGSQRASERSNLAVGQNRFGSHFGVGEFTTHFRTYFSGDRDVHWGCGILTHGHLRRSPAMPNSA